MSDGAVFAITVLVFCSAIMTFWAGYFAGYSTSTEDARKRLEADWEAKK